MVNICFRRGSTNMKHAVENFCSNMSHSRSLPKQRFSQIIQNSLPNMQRSTSSDSEISIRSHNPRPMLDSNSCRIQLRFCYPAEFVFAHPMFHPVHAKFKLYPQKFNPDRPASPSLLVAPEPARVGTLSAKVVCVWPAYVALSLTSEMFILTLAVISKFWQLLMASIVQIKLHSSAWLRSKPPP